MSMNVCLPLFASFETDWSYDLQTFLCYDSLNKNLLKEVVNLSEKSKTFYAQVCVKGGGEKMGRANYKF